MTQLWKKIIHVFAVLFVAAAMVFSFLEPKTTVVAEEGQDDGGTAVSTASPQSTGVPNNTSAPVNTAAPAETPVSTAAPAETPVPTEQPAATPTAEPGSQSHAITIDPIDTDDAYFNENQNTFYIATNKAVPFHFTVHNGPETDSPAIEGAEVQVDTKDVPVKYDGKNKTLKAEYNVSQYYSGNIILKYGDSEREVLIDMGPRYYMNLSQYELRMEPQTTSEEAVQVSVYDRFKEGTQVENPDYTANEAAGDDVTFDKATGKVTSYDKYGSFNINFTYKDASTSLNVYVYAPVQSLSFTQDEISLRKDGGSTQLDNYLKIEPDEAWMGKLEAVSSNPYVVTVDNYNSSDADLNPVSEGTAYITVTAEDGVSATIKVTVTEAGTASEIQFDPEYNENSDDYRDIYLKSGESKELKAYLFDADHNDVTESAKDEITYTIVGQYNAGGKFELNGDTVTATGSGEAQIKASIGNGWEKEIRWNVHVTDKEPESISFYQKEYQVHLGSYYGNSSVTTYVSLTGKPDGIDMNNIKCTVKSDDESIVKVNGSGSSWYLEPVKTGTATITATTANGETATAKVVVDDGDYANDISSDTMEKAIPMKPGDTFILQPVYTLPGGRTTTDKPKDEKVTYSFPDYLSQYVKLTENQDGTATVKALDFNNNVYITATLTNGQSTNWNIQITPDITSLHFTKKEITVTDENQYNYLYQYLDILPEQARGSELAWSSSDIRTATVDNYGNVHIIKYDSDVTITASTKDGKLKDSILVHCRKAEAPESITINRSGDVNLYTGYKTQFRVKKTPDYASSQYNVLIDDPDHVTDLKQADYQGLNDNSYITVTGKKQGDARITISSAKDPSVKKTVNIHVKDGKPSAKDLDLDYQMISGGYGWDGDENYDPAVDLFKDQNSAIGILHPKKFTFLKGRYYDVLIRYKGYNCPVNGFVKDENDLLTFQQDEYGIMGSYSSGYSLEHEWFEANQTGTGKLKIGNNYTIDYQVVDAEVNDKPVIDTGNAKGDLKDEITKITNESIGMNDALQIAASTLNLSENETVQKAADNLRDGQELKVEITNVIKYESVEDTGTSRKITVSITPKYVVKVVNKDTKNQESSIIDEGEIKVSQNVTLRVPVGKDLEGRTLYIRHIKKNGTSRIYEGTVDEKGDLVFDNPDGFSTFEITAENPATVQYGSIGYESLEDALNNGLVQGTVKVLKGYKGKTDVTVKREMAFTLDNESGRTFNIKAGDGYTLKQDGNNYTITQNYQKDDDDTKPDWGTPVFTFTDNGTKAVAVRTNKNNGSQTQQVNAEVKQTEKVDPTCTEKGKTVYTATAVFDGQTYTDQYTAETDALGHDLQDVPATPSTKDKEGNIEYWKCTRCGKYFSDASGTQEIDPKSVVTPASKLSFIAWSEEPADEQKSWTEGTSFHYAGKAVLTYEDGETAIVDVTDRLFDLEGYNPDQIGEQTVTLKLRADKNLTLNETITVNAKVETGIQVSAKNAVLTIGQTPSKSDLKVERLFNNGKSEAVSDAYEIAYEVPAFTEQEILNKTVKKFTVTVTETATGYTATVEFEVKPNEYKLKEGNKTSVVLEKNADYSFRSEASSETFKDVAVDGKIIDHSNYTVTSGSTVVTLKASYLNTLSEGRHTIQIISDDGIAEGTFTVQAKESDQKNNGQKADGKASNGNTGKKSDTVKKNDQKAGSQKNSSEVADTSDHSNIGLFGGTLTCAVIAIAAVLWIRRKHA